MKLAFSFLVSGCGHVLFYLMKKAYLPINKDWNGLGNRIKGIANFYQLGYRNFTLLWNTTSWVTDSFHNLFFLDGCKVDEHTSLSKKYHLYGTILRRFLPLGIVREEYPYWSFILPKTYHREEFKHKWSFTDKMSYSIDFRFNAIPEDIRDLYRPFFKNLKPSALVNKRLADITLPEKVVGVQIRNTGIKEDKKGVCSLETIYAAMEREPADTIFFISAMNTEIANLFKERFPNRVLELPNKQYTSMVDAVADMWLLGQCAKMIVSPNSTFSEVAWWWGGATASVVHLETEYNQANL